MRRPRILIRAALAGQKGWNRDRNLHRLLGRDQAPSTPVALRLLRARESELNAARLAGRADYDMQRHVLVMIALMAELQRSAPVAAPGAADPVVIDFNARGTARQARHA